MTAEINTATLKLDWDSGVCLRPLAAKYGISPATAKKYLNGAGVDTSQKKCYSKKDYDLIEKVNMILAEYDTRLTVRQVYYQMASRHFVELSDSGYQLVSKILNIGRKYGSISWDKIEDRTRIVKSNPEWDNLEDFLETVKGAYSKNIWPFQPNYFEVWLEKEALFGVVAPHAMPYGVKVQVTKGYPSISTIYEAAKRFKDGDTILYLGDHDASGVDMDRNIIDSFKDNQNLDINVERIGLLYEDIERYNLLPNPLKESDPRAANYPYEKQAELDSLSPDILKKRIIMEIEKHLDMNAYNECKRIEQEEMNTLLARFYGVQKNT